MVKLIDYDEQGNVRVTRVFNGEIKEERIYRKEDIEVISEKDCRIPIQRISLQKSNKDEFKDLFDFLTNDEL